MDQNLFKKYYKKMAVQGLIKALLLGAIVGFAAMLVMSSVSWLVDFKYGWWISLILLFVVTIAATPIFYFTLYKPDTKKIARKLDETGLEERMITMTEYANDDSYIARRQREDAVKALNSVNTTLLKFAVAIPVVVAIAVVGVLGTGMTVTAGLSATNVISGGKVILSGNDDDETIGVTYEVVYEVEGDGEIIGEFIQVVEAGKDAEPVIAEPLEGFVFAFWEVNGLQEDTEKPSPERQDLKINANLTVVAHFQEADPNGDGDGDGDGDGEGDSGEGGSQGGGEGQPSDDDKPSDGSGESESEGKPSDGQGGGAGGEHSENNSVIDGDTYYGDSTYDGANQDSQDELGGNSNVSDRDKDIISDYFDTIKN